MSTPPPNHPWGQPQIPQQPGEPQQPAPPPAGPAPGQWPPAAPTMPQVPVTPAGGGGNSKKTLAILVGAVAVVAIGLVGFLVLRGDDDDSSSGDRRDRNEERDDRDDGDERGDDGDPDDAVDVARDLIQALIDGDCDRAADLATDDFVDEDLDASCGEAPEGAEVHDVTLEHEDPVVVLVLVESEEGGEDGISELPLEMVYEDGDWLVDGFYFGDPDTDGPAADEPTAESAPVTIPDVDEFPTVSDDPEEIAEQAIQAVIDGDCDTALALATIEFAVNYGEEICSGELLPPDATITGVETTSDAPLIVAVDVDVEGEAVTINLSLAEEFGALLISDYGVS